MTMPGERAWALCGAESFLTEVRRYHDLPENLRYQIPTILRHCFASSGPSSCDMAHQASHKDNPPWFGGRWLEPKEAKR